MKDGGFLVGYIVGGGLILLGMMVQDWLYERKTNREIQASKDRMHT